MNKQKITAVITSFIVICAAVGFSACASTAAAEQKSSFEAQVKTAAAATLVQYMIETQVAVQSRAMVFEPVVQVQATEPPVPTPTPIPTEAPQPTVAVTVAATGAAAQPAQAASPTPTALPVTPPSPKIVADQNTNCRVGPSTGYVVQTIFLKGSESRVEGRDSGKNWWYIANPIDSSKSCWVWEGSTTVVGDTSTLPVVGAPSGVNPKASNNYNDWYFCDPFAWCDGFDDYYCGCVNYPYDNWHPCPPDKWNKCNPYFYCTYNTNCKNPCKKSNCPPLTIVNYKNYCKNYPKCCK